MLTQVQIISATSLYPIPQYVVVLEDLEQTHLVPIWIGQAEGHAISMALNKEEFPRPLSHDLMLECIRSMGGVVVRVVISDLKDGNYYARLFLKNPQDQEIEIDARPSDCLALALRCQCPIYVHQKVLDMSPRLDEGITKGDIDKFKAELSRMSPAEFFKTLESSPSYEETLDEEDIWDEEEDGDLDEDDDAGDDSSHGDYPSRS